jgi:hypothetical protein
VAKRRTRQAVVVGNDEEVDNTHTNTGWANILLTEAWQPQTGELTKKEYALMQRQKDKYRFYKEAIIESLKTNKHIRRLPKERVVNVLEIGSGFGGLVQCCIEAFAVCGRKLCFTAVEKNR